MNMPDIYNLDLIVQLTARGTDSEELDSLLRQLRQELLEAGIASAPLLSNAEQPQGTKGLDPVVLGALAIAIGPTLVTKLLEFLHAWALRREGRVVKIKLQNESGAAVEIEVPTALSPAEVKTWIVMTSEALSKHKHKK
jgi:hypothetical protein